MFQGEGFDVMKSGDARVALIGFPSVGKVKQFSSLICFIFYSILYIYNAFFTELPSGAQIFLF